MDDRVRFLGLLVANPGWAESKVFARLLANRDVGLDATVIHQDWPGGHDLSAAFQADARVPLLRFDMGWRPSHGRPRHLVAKALSLGRLLASGPTMYRSARAYRPDVVYSSQQRWDSLVAAQLAGRLRLPRILHLHYNIGPWLGSEVLARLRTSTHVIAVSDFIREQAIAHGVAPERVTTIRNAVAPLPMLPDARRSVRSEFGLPDDATLIGIVARLDPSKGQRDTIAAFAAVVARHATAQLLVIGEGDDELRLLHAQTASLGLERRVIFAGPRDDVTRLLAGLDVFAHPSRREPFGLAIVEAMASGLPVLCYDDGALPELVANGVTGMLVPAGDTAALAAALSELLASPALRSSIGQAAKHRVSTAFRPQDAGRAFSHLVLDVAQRHVRN